MKHHKTVNQASKSEIKKKKNDFKKLQEIARNPSGKFAGESSQWGAISELGLAYRERVWTGNHSGALGRVQLGVPFQ